MMKVNPVSVDNFRASMKSSTDLIDTSVRPETQSFEQTLLKAFDSVNHSQMKTETLSQQMIVDPESVDVHDVTIAMAEANLSLKIAQSVIDRVIKGWNDVTTNR
ncbi:flagellar hook-basal body complex protein FliE [Treponema zuelzerae]|uniref:Flagellar hook-basal body complex protein FliE n=1 Tax=Teretinema zuelzerae TaxID=156 RepID=A0AAE3EGB3_9SPIR|nr:flagellar hook-basal body complex protein FliE [Teretinema zuelzerae]MBN2811179.1 flagellar hook-basal body complex protein FliE [Spirochaetales bacterium]MCD1653241.1 flagellar hook-basal body complex protein FliE [Teretinema zuelzerae]HPO02779.1 flagellar hook-basal body complex protein FliE [Treponemataceae bacterium]